MLFVSEWLNFADCPLIFSQISQSNDNVYETDIVSGDDVLLYRIDNNSWQ